MTDYKMNGPVLEMVRRHDVTDEVGNAVIAPVLEAALKEGVPRDVLDRIAAKFGLRPKDAASTSDDQGSAAAPAHEGHGPVTEECMPCPNCKGCRNDAHGTRREETVVCYCA